MPDTQGLVRPSDLISFMKTDKFFIHPNQYSDDHSDYNFTSGKLP
jgi:hypothetical protein